MLVIALDAPYDFSLFVLDAPGASLSPIENAATSHHSPRVTVACCRFPGHEDQIVSKELEIGHDETEVQPRVQDMGRKAGDGPGCGGGAGPCWERSACWMTATINHLPQSSDLQCSVHFCCRSTWGS